MPVPAIALGSFEVTPLAHASALGAFANGGVHIEPHLIERVTDADGNVLFEAAPRRTKVWSETTAYLMLDMLRGNVVDRDPYGLSNRAELSGRWVGGKTGTTNNERDIWFVGLTPETVSAVWIGYDEPRPIPEATPNGEVIGSSRQPVWIWKRFAEEALAGKASRTLRAPRDVVFEKVNLSTGVPSAQGTRVAFARGTQPGAAGREVASYLNISVPIDTRTKTRASASTPREYLEWREISPNEVPRFAEPLPVGVGQPEGVQDSAQSSDAPTPGLPGTEPPDESVDDEDGVGWLDWDN